MMDDLSEQILSKLEQFWKNARSGDLYIFCYVSIVVVVN